MSEIGQNKLVAYLFGLLIELDFLKNKKKSTVMLFSFVWGLSF